MSDESSSSSEDERIDLSPFERQLASLEPRSCNLDRDRLMFLAGQAAPARGATQVAKQTQAMWFWQVVSGVSTVAATVLAVLLAISSADRTTSVADGSKPQVIAPTPKTSGTEPDRGSPVRNGGNAQTPILPAASPAATWPVNIANGKFHGLMQRKTPRPRSCNWLLSPVGPGICRGAAKS